MKSFNKGFTLIELLVVISIIGVLTALLLSNFVGIRERAKDAQLKSGLKQVKTAMRLYYNDNQSYPETTFMNCSGVACNPGDEFNSAAGGAVYMNELPEFDTYAQTNSGEGFLMRVTLNNISDADAAKSAAECSAPATDYYFYVCSD